MRPLRSLTYANVMSTVAVFVALGGSSYAAIKVTGKDIKDGTVTSKDVKNRSLVAKDFKKNQLPAGPRGATGPQGPKGDTGTVDTAGFYDKAASDARFLGRTAKAADADRIDGIDSTVFGSAATLTGSDLRPRSSDLEYRYVTGGGIHATGTLPADNGARSFIARLDLPHGATITSADFHFVDNVADGSWDLYLTRFNTALQFENVIHAGMTAGASTAVRTASAAPSDPLKVVDNAGYSYQVRAVPSQASANLVFTGVRVHYTLPTG